MLNCQPGLSQTAIEEHCYFLLLLVIEEHALAGLVKQGTQGTRTTHPHSAQTHTHTHTPVRIYKPRKPIFQHSFMSNRNRAQIRTKFQMSQKRTLYYCLLHTCSRTHTHAAAAGAVSHAKVSIDKVARWQSRQRCSAGQVTALSHIPINVSSCAFSVSARRFPFGLCKKIAYVIGHLHNEAL